MSNAKNWGKKYMTARKEIKKTMSEMRDRAFDRLLQSLSSKKEERSIYRLAKYRGKKEEIFGPGVMH